MTLQVVLQTGHSYNKADITSISSLLGDLLVQPIQRSYCPGEVVSSCEVSGFYLLMPLCLGN